MLIASCLCMILSAVLLMNLETPRAATRSDRTGKMYVPIATGASPSSAYSSLNESAGASPPPPKLVPLGASAITQADIDSLSVKNLLIPVAGVTANQLRDSFLDPRSEGRMHQALDIMAPRDTPVLAVDDGKVIKLHQSDRGGTMLYESDPSGLYVYYYGHLSHYAEGVSEGKAVKRGEVIAYVGDTGNAGAGNFHLHFGISKMSASGKWSGGEPINPYSLLASKPGAPAITGGK